MHQSGHSAATQIISRGRGTTSLQQWAGTEGPTFLLSLHLVPWQSFLLMSLAHLQPQECQAESKPGYSDV